MPLPTETALARIVAHQLDITPDTVERVQAGQSTEVYRVRVPGRTIYARLLPEAGASLVPEALAHRQLRALDVPVPEVLFVAHVEPLLGRSVMLTGEIPGDPLGDAPVAAPEPLLQAAGRSLALLNRVAVRGWGWMRRDQPAPVRLEAEHSSFAAWQAHEFAPALRDLAEHGVLDRAEQAAVHAVLMRDAAELDREAPRLAHGDFDPTHIFHVDGVFSGMIDLGEMRGAHPLYDLGHFQIENRALLPALLAGYLDGGAPAPALLAAIHRQTLLIAIRRLARRVSTGRDPLPNDRPAVLRALTALETFPYE